MNKKIFIYALLILSIMSCREVHNPYITEEAEMTSPRYFDFSTYTEEFKKTRMSDNSIVKYPKSGQGKLAYEDNFPLNGDYDFNDVVISYKIKETLKHGLVKSVNATFVSIATGANYKNGFAVSFKDIINNIESISVQRNKLQDFKSHDVFGEDIIVNIFPDLHLTFSSYGFINTQDGTSVVEGDTVIFKMTLKKPTNLKLPPYDAFIFRTTNPSLEIHMADFEPTVRFDKNYFNTGDDESNVFKNKTFRNKYNLPWAINTHHRWNHPKENIQINDAYPNFRKWVISGGRKKQNWFMNNKVDSLIWNNNNK